MSHVGGPRNDVVFIGLLSYVFYESCVLQNCGAFLCVRDCSHALTAVRQAEAATTAALRDFRSMPENDRKVLQKITERSDRK